MASQKAAFAPGTMENLLCQWVKFILFCIHFGLVALPASTEVLTSYAQHLSCHFKAYGSVVNYLAGVKTLHKLLHFSTIGFLGFELRLTMKGLKRLNKYTTRQAIAMTPLILKEMTSKLNMQCPVDSTFWAASLVVFFLLLRKSNLVPTSLTSFDPFKQLSRQDFEWRHDRVLVTLRRTKTNQFGQHDMFSLPRIPGSILCPYTALQRMWALLPGDQGICFRRPCGRPVTYYQFQTKLRKTLSLINEPAHLYSTHSFRWGGTTFAFLCGIPTDLIKKLGGWKSGCYYQYLEFPMEARAAATDLMKYRIQSMQW